jgi:hypothetical protein
MSLELSNGTIRKGRVGLSIRRVTQLCHWDSYRPRRSAGYGSCAGRTWGRFREHVVASGAGTGGSGNQTLRVSTDRQLEGFGLDVQRDAVERWAIANGHEVVAVIAEEDSYGTREAADRPGLSEALNALEDGMAEGINVARLDRLARTLIVQEGLSKVWSLSGGVFSTDSGEVMEDDPDDPLRTALRQMIGVFGQLERSMIASRFGPVEGRSTLRVDTPTEHRPFGFRAEGRALVPVEDEQMIIARMRELNLPIPSRYWPTVLMALCSGLEGPPPGAWSQ